MLEDDGGDYPKAMVITMLPVNVVLPKLRQVLVNQVSVLQKGLQNVNGLVKRCLENISISMVFDVEGLQEVVGEIEATYSETADQQRQQSVRVGSKRPQESCDEAEVSELEQPTRARTEIPDSEDEDDGPGVSSRVPEAIGEKPIPQESNDTNNLQPTTNPPPDLILITHISPLLNTLFMGRDKPSAHDTMASLSSQLRHLAHIGPLIMILNSTTTSSSFPHGTSSTTTGPTSNQPPAQKPTPTELTLRSIFPQQQGLPGKNKPSFGLVFTQLLDLHLLCTRVARRKSDITGSTSTASVGATARDVRTGIGMSSHRFAWVVEVLLDEMGVYEYDYGDGEGLGKDGRLEKPISRRRRERRWGAVEVEEGGAGVVDLCV